MFKVSPTEYCYIYHIYIGRTDFEHHFLNYFESELFYRDGPFLKNVVFVETRKLIYSKLVNNPFKQKRECWPACPSNAPNFDILSPLS